MNNLPANQTDFLLYTSATRDVKAEVFLTHFDYHLVS